ncbi:MAG TPA: RES family NAD+ phosphorylase [Bryobacteraceae bacterium]
MILYRVSNHANLEGKGGELADGRWHTQQVGRRIVYLSDHPALCLLEMLVHLNEESRLPDSYQLLSVNVPDRLIEKLPQTALVPGWQYDIPATQRIGNAWLASRKGGLLVPSVVAPLSMNCLLNPAVSEICSLNVKIVGHFPSDQRILSR